MLASFSCSLWVGRLGFLSRCSPGTDASCLLPFAFSPQPKLLTDLHYHENMRVLVICNGEWRTFCPSSPSPPSRLRSIRPLFPSPPLRPSPGSPRTRAQRHPRQKVPQLRPRQVQEEGGHHGLSLSRSFNPSPRLPLCPIPGSSLPSLRHSPATSHPFPIFGLHCMSPTLLSSLTISFLHHVYSTQFLLLFASFRSFLRLLQSYADSGFFREDRMAWLAERK